MSNDIHHYDIGHWVVHSRYGLGQIEQIENISLYGDVQNKEKCFKVQTRDGVFWFPVNQNDNPRVRPILTQKKLISSLEILKEPPEDIDAHHNELRIRINNAQSDVSISTTLRLIRDLSAINAVRKLNTLEDRALNKYINRLIREWTICMDMDETEVRTEFERFI